MQQHTVTHIETTSFELTEEQAAFYAEHGYIIVRKLLSSESIARYNQRFADVANGVVPRDTSAFTVLPGKIKHNSFILKWNPGDTIFFNTLLIHGSGQNLSTSTRKACSTHYASAHCKMIDINGTVQEDFAREMETWAEKMGMPQGITFKQIWKGKSRRV